MFNGAVQNVNALGIQRDEIMKELEVVRDPQGRDRTQDGPHEITKGSQDTVCPRFNHP